MLLLGCSPRSGLAQRRQLAGVQRRGQLRPPFFDPGVGEERGWRRESTLLALAASRGAEGTSHGRPWPRVESSADSSVQTRGGEIWDGRRWRKVRRSSPPEQSSWGGRWVENGTASFLHARTEPVRGWISERGGGTHRGSQRSSSRWVSPPRVLRRGRERVCVHKSARLWARGWPALGASFCR